MKALTANRLSDGEVVFWNAGQWVERFADAELFDADEPAAAAEEAGKAQPTVVIDAYLIDLVESEGLWAPTSFRERLRALGRSFDEKDQEGTALAQASGIKVTPASPDMVKAIQAKVGVLDQKWIETARGKGLANPDKVLQEFRAEARKP